MKSKKNIIIITLLIIIIVMAVAYSALATRLTINGTAEIIGEWDVKIINIEAIQVSEGCNSGELQFTNTTATFDAELVKPGDSITYEITIQNAGNIDAKLDNATFKSDEGEQSPAIDYEVSNPAELLHAGEETKFTIMIKYKEDTVEVPQIKTKTITGVVEYVQE